MCIQGGHRSKLGKVAQAAASGHRSKIEPGSRKRSQGTSVNDANFKFPRIHEKEAAGYQLDVCPYLYLPETEVHMFIGNMLILLFKNLSHANYSNFISKRVCALGGKLGMAKKKESRLLSI
ncbi:hypothetical protein Tco_0200254 [Tanacetum coccineum]